MEFIATLLFLLNFYTPPEEARTSVVEGHWRVLQSVENKKSILILYRIDESKEETFTDRFGHFMEFNSDGTYTEHASAQCGLDDNRFSYSGAWNFDSLILDLSTIKVQNARPNIYNKYSVRNSGKLKLISQKENELKFEILKHWENIH